MGIIDRYLVYYNYFEDVNYDYFDMAFSLDKRNDPDKRSAKLYDSFFQCYFEDFYSKMKNKCIKIGSWQTKDDYGYSYYVEDGLEKYKQIHILSMDYIGPSICQAKNIAEMTENEIKSFLKISRTLGGHIVWERGKGNTSINVLRGGELHPNCGYGFYDRIDWTLLLLKIYYESNGLDEYKDKINKLFAVEDLSENDNKCFDEMWTAFSESRTWLGYYETFKGFCDFFKLKGSFVDDGYDVKELTDYIPIKPKKYGYRRYIENSLKAIELRNMILCK